MSDDEQSPRSLRMKKKKDGPNWFMIAGGAVVMAVSVAFGRKKILNERAGATRHHRQAAASYHGDDDDVDDTRSVDTYETVHDGTSFWDKAESHADSFEFRSFKTKRAAPPSDQSPQASKLFRQLSRNSISQSNQDPAPCDIHASTALRARREMVHRLRQQIRSRDAMIYDMQTQLEDQERMVSMHRNHSADLQECVQAVSAKLFEANLEVQRLHRELSAQAPVADLDDECIDIAVAEIKRKWVHPKDVEEVILEARRLNEEVERLQREKEVKDNLAQAKSRQCELLTKKVSSLATELEEAKTAAHGKQRLLEAKEQENLKLTSALHDLQQKLQIESRDNDWARSSKLIRRTDALNINSGWKANHSVARPVTPPNFEGVSSTYEALDGHHNYHQAKSVSSGNPCASVHARNDSQQDSEDSVSKAESDAHTKRFEQDDEGLIQSFGNEVDQVASALSATSKVVSEKMQAATRVLKKFQEHSESRTDAEGFNFSQVFFCLSESMSAEERQEMRNELEQAAKQQDVEREMKVLTKHQTKLEELKYVVAKVSARFSTEDNTLNTELASSLSDIEQKLALQEVIVKETSSIVEQLSTLFHVPSPQSPPIQEIWRTVKETSGATSSVNGHHTQSDDISSSTSRNALSPRGEETPSRTLERQDSSPAPRQHFSPSGESVYQFHLGASDGPVSTSRTRRTASRKPHESTVGSKRHSTTFRPESDVFSFGFSARSDSQQQQQLEGIVETAPPYEQEEQPGDRMSSPEPEAMISPSFSKRFRPCFGETSSRIPTPTKMRSSDEDIDFQIKRSTTEETNSNADCSPRIGVSPFAARMACLDVRQPGSPVASLRNFEIEGSRVTHLVDRDVESKDSSGSCNLELEPSLTFLPTLLRRSNSSNRQL